jgi:hypothetical protein
MKKLLAQIILGVSIGLVCLHIFSLRNAEASDCGGDPNCRNYASVFLTDTDYTGVHGRITYANPSLRDQGFTLETFWIVDAASDSWVEFGWVKQHDVNGTQPTLYWAHGNNGVYDEEFMETNTREHAFEIQHKTSDNKWHLYLDGVERASISLPFSQGHIQAGGESTDLVAACCPPSHNAMGTSGLSHLTYMKNHAGFYKWNGWDTEEQTDSYQVIPVGSDHFQSKGNNP